jgi:hypothetical protein
MELDVFSTLEREDTQLDITRHGAGKTIRECFIRVWRENWFFLILLSLTSAGVILAVDVVSSKLIERIKIRMCFLIF